MEFKIKNRIYKGTTLEGEEVIGTLYRHIEGDCTVGFFIAPYKTFPDASGDFEDRLHLVAIIPDSQELVSSEPILDQLIFEIKGNVND